MPQPSAWGPVSPPRLASAANEKRMSVGTFALIPSSSHMGRRGLFGVAREKPDGRATLERAPRKGRVFPRKKPLNASE
ncbi:hypothetical protein JCM2811A_41100 [Methylorubrum rhodinum]